MKEAYKKLNEELDKQVQKRKDSRAANQYAKSVEGIVFDFFKESDAIHAMDLHYRDFDRLFVDLVRSFVKKLRTIDEKCICSIKAQDVDTENSYYTKEYRPQTVVINWSHSHQKENGSIEQTIIALNDMLFV